MTYGGAAKNALDRFGINDTWETIVMDRAKWTKALEPANFREKPRSVRRSVTAAVQRGLEGIT